MSKSKKANYDNKTVKLWRQDRKLYKTLHGYSDRVYALAFSSDGKTIASASTDKTAILWNLDLALDLDELLSYGCHWVRDYLDRNPNGQKEQAVCLPE
ncbi:hypothetical protein F7734_17705 [Scytonema sp. UIC 10036]|nr:hypothetical protein [Scytonema sp. UIC 10036]